MDVKIPGKLSMYVFEENGALYRVYDFYECLDSGEPFYNNNAYIIRDPLRELVLPFRGELKDFALLFSDKTIPGIYQHKKTGKIQIRGPRNKKELEMYSPNKVDNLLRPETLDKYNANMFRDMHLEHKASGDIFAPPINEDDDYMSKAVKTMITAKQINFADYGPRLEKLAANKGDSSSGNARNNSKRALINNRSTSPSKSVYYGTAFDFQIALILRDTPDAPNPALKPGEQMVIYPASEPFKIDNLTPIEEVMKRNNPKATYSPDGSDGEADFEFED